MADRRPLVTGEGVHDDHVAGPELRHEHLVDIGLDRFAFDRAVEHHRGRNPIEAQARHEGGRPPVMGWTPPDGIDVPRQRCLGAAESSTMINYLPDAFADSTDSTS